MANGEKTEPEQPTIGVLLGACHSTCSSIEGRLRSIVVSPQDESTPGAMPKEAPPPTLTETLECDLADASGLSARLNRIENHVALVQDRLKALA